MKIINNLQKRMLENDKIIIKNIFGAFVIKGASLIISMFTFPAYIAFFNNEMVLGLWFTVLSVLNWILNFDLGIGNGLRNHLSRTLAQNLDDESERYISSAYISISVLCVVATVVFFSIFDVLDWNAIFNIETQVVSSEALLTAVKIVFVGIVVQLFLRLISAVLYAMQRSAINDFLSLCTSVLNVLAVRVIPSGTNDQNIVCMASVHALAVALPPTIATIVIFSFTQMRKIRPAIKSFRLKYARTVLSLGGVFFFVQIAYMLIMSTNDYLIALFAGNDFVVEYQIYYKIFLIGGTAFSLAITPVWSMVTKANAQNDLNWVKSLYKKLLLLAIVASMCELLAVLCLQLIMNLWLGENTITVNYLYAMCVAALGVFMILNSVLSSIANGLGKLKTQAIWFGIGAVMKLPMSWLLVQFTESWIGVVIANVIAILPYCVVQFLCLRKYLI